MERLLAQVVYPENQQAGFAVGDEAAHRAALDLAERADAPTIMALVDSLRCLELIGGQLHIITLRTAATQDGPWETKGFAINYESRDASMVQPKPPEEVFGVPVTELGEPSPELAEPEPEEPPQNGAAPEDEPIEEKLPEPALSE
jgi:hypothetical protein